MWLPRHMFQHHILLCQDVASLESRRKELGEGEVPLLISSAPLEMQTMGPASPQLEGVGRSTAAPQAQTHFILVFSPKGVFNA